MFGAAQDDAERRPKYQQFFEEVRELGATDLELVVAWSQADLQAIEVTPHPSEGVDDDLLTWVMDEAVSRNLRVFLTPVIDLENKDGGAHRAALEPSDSEHWWWSYRRFVMHYARIAGTHKAALFSVGNQLLSNEADATRWRALIGDVRKVYSGKVTYTAHPERFESIAFWDALDLVSIGGPLGLLAAAGKDGGVARACSAFAGRVRTWAQANDKRYVLAGAFCMDGKRNETQRNGGSNAPSENMRQLIEQRAFYESFHGDGQLDGVFVPQTLALDAALDQAPTLRTKSAREVLRHWFVKSRAAPSVAPTVVQ